MVRIPFNLAQKRSRGGNSPDISPFDSYSDSAFVDYIYTTAWMVICISGAIAPVAIVRGLSSG